MDESSPKVSIVLATHNGAKYIKQSIDSCLNQTYKNIQLIIIDDASTDETPEIIKSYKDNHIIHLAPKKNLRLPKALNLGFSYAVGDYLTWTSDDNEYLPEAIETMKSYLDKNKHVDLVYADYWAYYRQAGEKL
jgi:glycosyltransferase involved in cell wall biosynthesis